MKIFLSIGFVCFALFSLKIYSQNLKTISFEYLNSRVYSTKSTVSDNFNARENGNLTILSMEGFKIQFKNTYFSESKFKFRLRAGFERNLQKYVLPYYQYFPVKNDITNLYRFNTFNTNLSLGIEKEFKLIESRLYLIAGLDVVARTLKSNSVLDVDIDDFYVHQNNDVFLRLNINSPSNGGNVVGQLSSFLEYRLRMGVSFFAGAYLTPRFKTGYQYQVLSYSVYETDGVTNTYIHEDRSDNETLSIKHFLISGGLNYSF